VGVVSAESSEDSIMFDVVGYSERGMMNALFHDMWAKPSDKERLARLADFLGQCCFPRHDPDLPFREVRLRSAKIRIEQSFSTFGTLDALLLLEEEADPHEKHAVFIEAKVKTSQRESRPILQEWSDFETYVKGKESASNLFLQLYWKVCLVQHLTHRDEELEPCSVPRSWELGANPIVKTASEELRTYCGSVWYLTLVPSSRVDTQDFFANTLAPYNPAAAGVLLPYWSVDRWGYLCWKDLEDYCADNDRRDHWKLLLRNYDYNREQIYGEPLAPGAPITCENVEAFLRDRSDRERHLIRAIALAEGEMKQGDIMNQLTFLGGNEKKLGKLKADINKACDKFGLARILGPGAGKGAVRTHRITPVGTQLRTWVIEIARDWDLVAVPTATT
jgi:hypothetical protein